MGDLLFLKEFLRNWKDVGFPFPTSRHAAQKVCELVDFDRGRTFIEVGAGTGSITRQILSSLRDGSRLTVLEINRDFCQALRDVRDSRLKVLNKSAFQLCSVAVEKADCVISGIPIAGMSKDQFSDFLHQVMGVLAPGGTFIQIQIAPVSYSALCHYFKEVKVAFAFLNTPPMVLYRCRAGR
jgi:phosphatidylethanolamine/phosphatidyl-N-methylethanolamine N-methyltransferase